MKLAPLALAVAALALLAVPSAFAGNSWQTPARTELSVAANPGTAAWSESCPVSGQQRILARSLRGAIGAARTVLPCSSVMISQPSLAYNLSSKQLYAVWSQVTLGRSLKSAEPGIYQSVSKNAGDSWSKPRRLASMELRYPVPVKAAAYAHQLFVMYSNGIAGNANHRFQIHRFDARTGKRGGPVAGVAAYRVFPSADSMGLYANRDGVVAFWSTFNFKAGTQAWHLADTARIDPFDVSKAVKFVHRGTIGVDGTQMMVGRDGLLYKLNEKVARIPVSDPTARYSFYRYRFASHRWDTVLAGKAEVHVQPTNLRVNSPLIAADVDAAGTLNLVLGRNEQTPSCLTFYYALCAVSTPGAPFTSYLELVTINRAGAVAVKPVRMPFASAQSSSRAVAQILAPQRRSANAIIFGGSGGPRLFGSAFIASIDADPAAETFLVNTRNAQSIGFWQYLSQLR